MNTNTCVVGAANADQPRAPTGLQRTLRAVNDADGPRVITIDQTRIPFEHVNITLTGWQDCARAIKTMQVRGAPLIGAIAAYGLALALRSDSTNAGLDSAMNELMQTRPTAVNLRWALERVRDRVAALSPDQRAAAAWQQACEICDEDVASNVQIGEHILALLQPLIAQGEAGSALQILTHCNAGSLATAGYGTALAPIYLMAERGLPVHVWVDETRPRNQGASLTAWELAQAGIDHTVITDNAGGLLMMRGEVDAVVLGCDRVAANGDVVNKIGTYLKALAARAHNIPFYVACPTTTIDMRCAMGSDVPIEYRDPSEVSDITGTINGSTPPSVATVRVIPVQSTALNPAFDITPAALVSALVTECGACDANADAISSLGLAS